MKCRVDRVRVPAASLLAPGRVRKPSQTAQRSEIKHAPTLRRSSYVGSVWNREKRLRSQSTEKGFHMLGSGRAPRRYRKRATRQLVAAAVTSAALTVLVLPLSSTAQTQASPANTSPPTISGTTAQGHTLVGGTGSWTGTAPISFAFRWWRCDDTAANCAPIDDATNTTYVLQPSDVGKRMRLAVTASNADGTASALSDATAVVTAGGVPTLTTEPRISGSAVVGQRLSSTTGTWTGDQPITFAYQWVRCGADGGNPDGSNCTNIAGATGTTYVLTSAESGYRMRFRVTATNAAGSRTAASNPTGTVQANAPVNTKGATISGTMLEGQTVTVSPGTWTGAAPITYTYQWLRCNSAGGACVAIAGATATQYRLTSGDVGHKMRANVTARNTSGSTTVMSGESAVVASAGPPGLVVLPTGEKSIPVSSVPNTERLVVDRVTFTPSHRSLSAGHRSRSRCASRTRAATSSATRWCSSARRRS